MKQTNNGLTAFYDFAWRTSDGVKVQRTLTTIYTINLKKDTPFTLSMDNIIQIESFKN